jgi:hypothetical protein
MLGTESEIPGTYASSINGTSSLGTGTAPLAWKRQGMSTECLPVLEPPVHGRPTGMCPAADPHAIMRTTFLLRCLAQLQGDRYPTLLTRLLGPHR